MSIQPTGATLPGKGSGLEPEILWISAMQRLKGGDARARHSSRWAALIVLPTVVQSMADSCHPADDTPAATLGRSSGWDRLGRFTNMSLATLMLFSRVTGAGLANPRGTLSLLRLLGWQVATTELLLPKRD